MSEAEVKNDVAAEAPSAEELKSKKRSAEVYFLRYSPFFSFKHEISFLDKIASYPLTEYYIKTYHQCKLFLFVEREAGCDNRQHQS